MIYKQFLTLISTAALLVASGCSSFGGHPQQRSLAAPPKPDVSEAEAPTRPIERETLFELLLAEFAGKRNRADVALGKYLKQAHYTRDPQVAERATFIARYLGAHQATLDASILWSEIEPQNPVPREMASIELIRVGKLDEAMEQVDQLMASGGRMNFEYLLEAARASDQPTRQAILAKLTEYSKTLDDDKLWFAKGSLEAMNGEHKQAIDDYDRALRITPSYGNAILGRAQSLIALNRHDEAMKYLSRQTSLWPENKRLGVAYARYLMQQNQLDAAQQQFYRLSQNFPEDGDLVLSLALLCWENQNSEEAITQFNKLLTMGHRTDEANIYLARIAAGQKRYDEAAAHFMQVRTGPQYSAARIQYALMLQDQGNTDQALQSLDEASTAMPLEKPRFTLAKSEILANADRVGDAIKMLDTGLKELPDDTSMLYSRAMLKEQQGDFTGMEQDLRQVLTLQPNNSAALNALGYTFANRNQRLNEAWQLIERAYSLNPSDPAIIDSMGWIKYRMGENQVALDYLRKAYEAFDDQEIAAHLGEVLWVSGKRDEAAIIWRNALEKTPDSKILKEVMGRFLPAPK